MINSLLPDLHRNHNQLLHVKFCLERCRHLIDSQTFSPIMKVTQKSFFFGVIVVALSWGFAGRTQRQEVFVT